MGYSLRGLFPARPLSQAELQEDMTRQSDAFDEDMDLQDPHYLDREEPLHSSICGWDNCSSGPYWLIEDLLDHLINVHINTQESKKPICNWADCARNGKSQASRFALMAHLRSHTGEKPFICPKPGVWAARQNGVYTHCSRHPKNATVSTRARMLCRSICVQSTKKCFLLYARLAG